MKKILVLTIAACGILFFADCHKKAYPVKSKEVAKEKSNAPAAYTAEQVAKGKPVFEANCKNCHDLPRPADHTISYWNDILPKMIRKSNLSEANGQKVTAYVMTNAKAG